MTNYTSIILKGGMGNQLFQVFTTISYALDTNKSFYFLYSTYLTVGNIRNTYWDSLLHKIKQYTVSRDMLNYII